MSGGMHTGSLIFLYDSKTAERRFVDGNAASHAPGA